MDEAGSLSGLEGQDWAKWMRRMGRDRPEDDLNGVDSPDDDASKPTAHCKRLPLKDHHLFGHCPEVDPFVAAVCEYCQKIVKIPFLQQHIAKAHNGMLKRYKIKEEPKPEVSVKQPSPPVVSKAPKVLPVMGKQSILVAAAARFAEAPLSPPSQPEVPAVVVKTEKSRKRGRSNKAEAPEKRRRVETAAGYNPDIHCGVWNEQTKTNCLRALTCRIHSLVLKRAVPMRTRLFDDLLAQHKAQHKLKKEASSSQVEEDGDVVIEEEEEEAAGRPNGRIINGSFANAEISLEDYPIANHEFLELPFPKLWASPSSEVLRRPILGDFQMPHKLQPPERWPIDDALDCRPPAPKPLMVCNTSNLRKFGGYLGINRGLQVLRRKIQCLVHSKENNNKEIGFDNLGFPPDTVKIIAPARTQPVQPLIQDVGKRKKARGRAVVARRLRQGKVKYRLKLVRHRKHKNHRVTPKKPQQVPQQQVLLAKKRKAGSYKENSSLNGTKAGESLLVTNRAAVGLLGARPHSALGDAAAAHPSTASMAIGSQMEADALRANKSKGTLIRLSDLAETKNHKKSTFGGTQTMVTVQQVPRVLSAQLNPVPGESSSLKFMPAQSKSALFSFSKKDHEKT